MVSAMDNLTSGVFGHLDITSTMDVYQRLAYTQIILRGSALKKYKAVLLECKQLVKYIAVDKWTLGEMKGLSTNDFWAWEKSDGLDYYGDAYLGLYKCVNFDKEIWFELGKCMRRNHHIVFQDHLKYLRNDIVNPFCVGILRYAERIQVMHDLAKQLPPI